MTQATGVLTADLREGTRSVGLLARERIIAGPGFNRWLVPPAALAIQLCIGMAYGFSVFWLPLSRAVNGSEAIACPPNLSFLEHMTATGCDWKISELGWVYTLFFVFLGAAAAGWGGWLERAGPRKAGFVAALCWCGGLLFSAVGIYQHQLWMLLVGSGIVGGIGLGLGYISPISTLIKWFPERRGMATGMAIMGFGGGAMIGAPLADMLMRHFATSTSVGVWQTFATLAVLYFVFMTAGAFAYRLPARDWKPARRTPASADAVAATQHVRANQALKTPQFWLLWLVLCLNATAGIGILGMASPMLQEVFAGKLVGMEAAFNELSAAQLTAIAAIAAGFTGLLSLFNIGGRFIWATLSDFFGRKLTYYMFFVLGIAFYASAAWAGHLGVATIFVGSFCMILSMYGGGFAVMPAYLADMFGTQNVGAITGRLLTAWSAAGILGPAIVNYLREYQLGRGVPHAEAYDLTAWVLCALLGLGLLCNHLVEPVADKHFTTDAEVEAERRRAQEVARDVTMRLAPVSGTKTPITLVLAAWLAVCLPIAWGVWITVDKASVLFK